MALKTQEIAHMLISEPLSIIFTNFVTSRMRLKQGEMGPNIEIYEKL